MNATDHETPPYRAWGDGELKSPVSGEPLRHEGPGLLSDGERLWPVIEGIPYLRSGREALREEAVSCIEDGDAAGALAVLLRDQDDWAPDPPPALEKTSRVATGRYPLRRAMEMLGLGRVGDYLAYRASDPTYLSGLALIQDNLSGVSKAFQLACGIGHYSRDLAARNIETTASDVVFAKVWLARRHVAPTTRLLCFDAAGVFPPSEEAAFDLVFCQDAFYFLPEKDHVAGEMTRIAGENGTVIVGHAHNADAENLSSGAPLTVRQYAVLFHEPLLYDDGELTGDLLSGGAPVARSEAEVHARPAVCLVQNRRGPERGISLALPRAGTPLSVNPLYESTDGSDSPPRFSLNWPSERYEKEYAHQSSYLPESVEIPRSTLELASLRGAGSSPEVDELARCRILLDLPQGWR